MRVDVLTTDLLSRSTFMGPHDVDFGSQGRIRYVKACRVPGLVKRNLHLHIRLYVAILRDARRYDFVEFADYRGLLPLVLLLLRRFSGVRLIHHSFGMISQPRVGKKRLWDLAFQRLFVRSVDLCFAENVRERAEYIALGVKPERVRVLPHPVTVPARFRDPHGASQAGFGTVRDGPLRLCFVGRMHRTKGIVRAVELLNALRPAFPGARLTIMGNDDGARDEVLGRIAALDLGDAVELRDAAYDDSRFDLYAASDAFLILPEDNLQTSLAAAEALTVGTPVITNRNCRIDGLDAFVLYVDDMPLPEVVGRIASMRSFDRRAVAARAQEIFSPQSVSGILYQSLVAGE